MSPSSSSPLSCVEDWEVSLGVVFIYIIPDPQRNPQDKLYLCHFTMRNMKLRGWLNDLVKLLWLVSSRPRVYSKYLAQKLMFLWYDFLVIPKPDPGHVPPGYMHKPPCLCDESHKVRGRKKFKGSSNKLVQSFFFFYSSMPLIPYAINSLFPCEITAIISLLLNTLNS